MPRSKSGSQPERKPGESTRGAWSLALPLTARRLIVAGGILPTNRSQSDLAAAAIDQGNDCFHWDYFFFYYYPRSGSTRNDRFDHSKTERTSTTVIANGSRMHRSYHDITPGTCRCEPWPADLRPFVASGRPSSTTCIIGKLDYSKFNSFSHLFNGLVRHAYKNDLLLPRHSESCFRPPSPSR